MTFVDVLFTFFGRMYCKEFPFLLVLIDFFLIFPTIIQALKIFQLFFYILTFNFLGTDYYPTKTD